MRKLPALIAAAGLIAVSLTACSTSQASACTGGAPSGDASKAVKVSGEFGAVPKVDFPTPLKADETQSTVITHGTGPGIIKGQMVTVDLSVYNGTTGKLIEKTEYSKDEKRPLSARRLGQAGAAGSRQGAHVRHEGLARHRRRAAEGCVRRCRQPGHRHRQDRQSGLRHRRRQDLPDPRERRRPGPQGRDADRDAQRSGSPGRHHPRLQGTYRTSRSPRSRRVTAQRSRRATPSSCTTPAWSGTARRSSTPAGSAALRHRSSRPPEPTCRADIEGFADALVGKTVGSQVIAVIPPDKGYGDTARHPSRPDSTIVFVVDVLGIEQ